MPVDVEVAEGVCTITLNRPERMNAMDADAYAALSDAWTRVRDDGDIRAAVVTGAGERAFTTGADLKSFVGSPDDLSGFWQTQRDMLLNRGLEVFKPIVAAVNGYCLGGGMTLLLATDIRVAAEHASFGLAEVKRGVVAANGGTQRVLAQLPHAIAMEVLLTGDRFDAATAERWGLVNRVVPQAELLSTAHDYAARIARKRPAGRPGGQGARAARARHGPRLGPAPGADDEPPPADLRRRQGGPRRLRREARPGLRGPLR